MNFNCCSVLFVNSIAFFIILNAFFNITFFKFVESYLIHNDDGLNFNSSLNESDIRSNLIQNRNTNGEYFNMYHIHGENSQVYLGNDLAWEELQNLKDKNVTIVCNLKCYLNNELSNKMISLYAKLRFPERIEILTCPSLIHLKSMVSEYHRLNSRCVACSQNVSQLQNSFGPYTGEITAGMLKDLGVDWTIVGHSECESSGNANDKNVDVINQKVRNAFKSGLNVILCIGEPKNFNSDLSEYLSKQLKECLKGVDLDFSQRLIVAYEPHYSIGTKKPADPDLVSKVVEGLKSSLEGRFNDVKFIYGGSVDENNAGQYLSKHNIDGIMVGRVAQDERIVKLLENVIKLTNSE